MDFLRQRTLELLLGEPLRIARLKTLAACGLPQGMLCAGFVRNAIWDEVFGLSTAWADLDVTYYDPADLTPAREWVIEAQLTALLPAHWQVRNQARMHLRNGVTAYASAADAVSRFPETATCLAVSLDAQGALQLPVDLGLADGWAGAVRLNARCTEAEKLVPQRLAGKGWLAKWPGLEMSMPEEAWCARVSALQGRRGRRGAALRAVRAKGCGNGVASAQILCRMLHYDSVPIYKGANLVRDLNCTLTLFYNA